jgi:hypothetical protein
MRRFASNASPRAHIALYRRNLLVSLSHILYRWQRMFANGSERVLEVYGKDGDGLRCIYRFTQD